MKDLKFESGHQFRSLVRRGEFSGPTAGRAPGYLQGNVVILPGDYAHEFLRYCLNNPKPCPLIGLSRPGYRSLPNLGDDIDICHDIPKYQIFHRGKLADECSSIENIWRENLVTFVLGCSFTFEQALIAEGYPIRHIETNKNVSMYSTNYPTYASGRFSGPLVVTMRPVKKKELDGVYAICSQFSHAHGAPIFHGNPKAIGIEDLSKPDYGDAVEVRDDEVPVFWACGVTTQEAISFAKPPICITHAPGHMLIADVKSRSLPNIVDNTRDFFESFASSSGF